MTATENICYKNQSAADEIIEQNTQNGIMTAYYYHLVILINVNSSKQLKRSNVFIHVC